MLKMNTILYCFFVCFILGSGVESRFNSNAKHSEADVKLFRTTGHNSLLTQNSTKPNNFTLKKAGKNSKTGNLYLSAQGYSNTEKYVTDFKLKLQKTPFQHPRYSINRKISNDERIGIFGAFGEVNRDPDQVISRKKRVKRSQNKSKKIKRFSKNKRTKSRKSKSKLNNKSITFSLRNKNSKAAKLSVKRHKNTRKYKKKRLNRKEKEKLKKEKKDMKAKKGKKGGRMIAKKDKKRNRTQNRQVKSRIIKQRNILEEWKKNQERRRSRLHKIKQRRSKNKLEKEFPVIKHAMEHNKCHNCSKLKIKQMNKNNDNSSLFSAKTKTKKSEANQQILIISTTLPTSSKLVEKSNSFFTSPKPAITRANKIKQSNRKLNVKLKKEADPSPPFLNKKQAFDYFSEFDTQREIAKRAKFKITKKHSTKGSNTYPHTQTRNVSRSHEVIFSPQKPAHDHAHSPLSQMTHNQVLDSDNSKKKLIKDCISLNCLNVASRSDLQFNNHTKDKILIHQKREEKMNNSYLNQSVSNRNLNGKEIDFVLKKNISQVSKQHRMIDKAYLSSTKNESRKNIKYFQNSSTHKPNQVEGITNRLLFVSIDFPKAGKIQHNGKTFRNKTKQNISILKQLDGKKLPKDNSKIIDKQFVKLTDKINLSNNTDKHKSDFKHKTDNELPVLGIQEKTVIAKITKPLKEGSGKSKQISIIKNIPLKYPNHSKNETLNLYERSKTYKTQKDQNFKKSHKKLGTDKTKRIVYSVTDSNKFNKETLETKSLSNKGKNKYQRRKSLKKKGLHRRASLSKQRRKIRKKGTMTKQTVKSDTLNKGKEKAANRQNADIDSPFVAKNSAYDFLSNTKRTTSVRSESIKENNEIGVFVGKRMCDIFKKKYVATNNGGKCV